MLLREIEKFLREQEMPKTKIGRLVMNDPRLVGDMRKGRTLRPATERRVRDFMDDVRAAAKKGETQ